MSLQDLLADTGHETHKSPAGGGNQIEDPIFIPRFDGEVEGMVIGAADLNHPFSPHSPRFAEGLTEDDVAADPSHIPGVERRPYPSLSLNPAEMEAQLQAILEKAREESAETSNLILEFGPFTTLEQRLRGISQDLTDLDVAEVIMTKMRRVIHDVVVQDPMLNEREGREAGLTARMTAIESIIEGFAQEVEPFLQTMDEAGMKVGNVREGLVTSLSKEQQRLEILSKSLAPATIGNQIFESLSNWKNELFAGGPTPLVGDLRRHRNDQLARSLSNLAEVSSELRQNAGDAEWERTHGQMASEMAETLVNDVKELIRGVENQVDLNSVNKALDGATENLDFAAQNAVDEEHKSRMQKMIEGIREAVAAMMAALSKVFGMNRDGTATPNKAPPP
ncbi:hypothetical protein [Paucibacter soli]|uniref:hypothetical protein n=1 Tax=Paucibacter soli TaxID=3133433 RepID=UPI0030A62090